MDYHRVFQIGEREVMGFYLYQALRQKMLGAVGFGIVGLLVCWLYGGERAASTGAFVVAMLVTFAAVMAAILLGYYFTIRGKVRAAVRRRGKERYAEEILVNGFGLRATANGKEVKVAFEKIREVRETKKAFYIYMTENDAWILPKAQMEDIAGEAAVLRRIFDTVLESKKLHFRGE